MLTEVQRNGGEPITRGIELTQNKSDKNGIPDETDSKSRNQEWDVSPRKESVLPEAWLSFDDFGKNNLKHKPNIASTMTIQRWVFKASMARNILEDSVREDWLRFQVKLPTKGSLNVLSVAKESGVLREEELLITGTHETGPVEKMRGGEWSAEQVLIAFAKRATIGHQLVSDQEM